LSEGSDFLVVPRAQLLLDDKRIERAVTYIAVPLRYTADEILAGAKNPAINTLDIAPASLPLPPVGVQSEEQSPFEVPRAEILSKVHRVVLGSINAGVFSPPAEVLVRYRNLVHHRLEKLGWEVARKMSKPVRVQSPFRLCACCCATPMGRCSTTPAAAFRCCSS
jgi:hypothetical protein